ncbi:MAG: type II toxin-antitoxin system VapC family toxin [Betaproteobacteria bacterium]|nr:MAG: type II toxin-antitoxin system VapC family toxin [Betaproteobacteria bacterium]
MILLDTHALLWMDRDDPTIGPAARSLIEQHWVRGEVAVSAISLWECAMLAQRGRISLPCTVETWRADLLAAGLVEVPLDGRIAVLAAGLENLHRDPADRFIAATALHKDAVLVTADEKLLGWNSGLRRIDARD